jgi:hypothetical protein
VFAGAAIVLTGRATCKLQATKPALNPNHNATPVHTPFAMMNAPSDSRKDCASNDAHPRSTDHYGASAPNLGIRHRIMGRPSHRAGAIAFARVSRREARLWIQQARPSLGPDHPPVENKSGLRLTAPVLRGALGNVSCFAEIRPRQCASGFCVRRRNCFRHHAG